MRRDAASFIDQVDRLVWQETVRDVTVRQRSRGHDGRVFDAHAMMHLVFFLKAAKDGNSVLDVGFADKDNLEAPLKGRVFLNVLTVFVQRGRADSPQFTTSQRGLQHVGRVNGAFRGAGTDQRMQFVDKKNDLPLRVFDFLEHGFEPVLKLPAIFRAGQHRSEVERNHALVLQNFRHIAGDNSLGQAFHNGGFAYAGFADEHGIIFGASRKNLHHAADFFIASDDRIEFAAARLLGEIAGITLQRLILGFGILIGNFLRAANNRERFQNCVIGCPVAGQYLLRDIPLQVRDRQQQMLGGNVFVLEVGSFFESLLEQLVDFIRKHGLSGASRNFGQLFEFAINLAEHGLRSNADLFQYRRNDAFLVFEQRGQQMQRLEFRIAVLGGELVGPLDGFLRFDGEFIPTDRHGSSLLSFVILSEAKNPCTCWRRETALASLEMAINLQKTGGGRFFRLPPRAIELRSMTGSETRSHTTVPRDLTRPCWAPCFHWTWRRWTSNRRRSLLSVWAWLRPSSADRSSTRLCRSSPKRSQCPRCWAG